MIIVGSISSKEEISELAFVTKVVVVGQRAQVLSSQLRQEQ